MQESDHIPDTECQLAVPTIAADGNAWASFSIVLAECDGDSGSSGCRTEVSGDIQNKSRSQTIEEVECGSWWTS